MSTHHLEVLDPKLRPTLATVRAEAWRGWMTPEEFTERNARLNAHELSGKRCQTYVWRAADGEIVTSMELYEVTLGLTDGLGSWSEEPAVLIASVITPPAHRGNGYASAMIEEYFRRHPEQNSVLYSDIGPRFYERFGFRAVPRFVTELPPGPLADVPARPITIRAFANELADYREDTLLDLEKPGASLLADPMWLDWHIERYRYFAELAGMPFFDRLFWRVEHEDEDHLLAFVPHFPLRRLEGLWVDNTCGDCLAFGAGLASEWGLSGFRFWSPERRRPEDKEECPMLRAPKLGPDAIYHDVQFCDWW